MASVKPHNRKMCSALQRIVSILETPGYAEIKSDIRAAIRKIKRLEDRIRLLRKKLSERS
jgi:hypothetical protein